MTLHLEIPDSISSSLRVPPIEVESRLRAELAIALYDQGILAFGKSCELAAKNRFAFAELLGQRGIVRHYGEAELGQDLDYAGRQ